MVQPTLNTTRVTDAQATLLLQAAKDYANDVNSALSSFRSQLAYRDQVYFQQLAVTQKDIAALQAATAGKEFSAPNVSVPIAMPQVESAVAYQAGVFLTSVPIFGVVASKNQQDIAMQFQATLGKQARKFGWVSNFITAFRNGYKHNFGPVLVRWAQQNVTNIDTSKAVKDAGLASFDRARYAGNMVKALDPYNCFFDFRVAPHEMHTHGEFFGYNEVIPRLTLKRFIASELATDGSNWRRLREAFETSIQQGNGGVHGMNYHVPQVNKMQAGMHGSQQRDWLQRMYLRETGRKNVINYKDTYIKSHIYMWILPEDFKLPWPEPKTPCLVHLTIINWQEVIRVERVISAHDFLPIVVAQPFNSGLGYQDQSLVDISAGFQQSASALLNYTLEGQRRQIFDRLLYNSKLVNKADIDPAKSVSRIPVQNLGINKEQDISKAVYQIPFRAEGTQLNVQLAGSLATMADEAAGQNRTTRGQFQKGNKTTTEFQTTVDNSNARQQLIALFLDETFMYPCKDMIRANTLRFQATESILDMGKREPIDVDPVQLRKLIMEFEITDGVLSSEKLMSTELMQVFIQSATTMPMLATKYDVMGMFAHWLKLQGASWVDEFKNDEAAQQRFIDQSRILNTPVQPPQDVQVPQ